MPFSQWYRFCLLFSAYCSKEMEGKITFRRNKRFNLAELSDEQLQELMDSVDTDDELTEFGSDDELTDDVENNQRIPQANERSI